MMKYLTNKEYKSLIPFPPEVYAVLDDPNVVDVHWSRGWTTFVKLGKATDNTVILTYRHYNGAVIQQQYAILLCQDHLDTIFKVIDSSALPREGLHLRTDNFSFGVRHFSPLDSYYDICFLASSPDSLYFFMDPRAFRVVLTHIAPHLVPK